MDKLANLSKRLQYQFADEDLLKRALTHRSRGSKNYERVEFLGDSILGFVIAEKLYHGFDNSTEGQLTRMRASLVRKPTLADVARNLQLGNDLILGEGELKSGGFNRDSILSDSVESIIGAIYLDGGLAPAKAFIERNFDHLIDELSQQNSFKDAKSQLQEYLQKKGLALPSYEIIETSGEDHQQLFTVECRTESEQAQAQASSRRLAEQQAAASVLEKLSKS